MAGKAATERTLPNNDAKVRTQSAIDGRATEFSIAGQRGLRLLVQPYRDGGPTNGHGAFVFRYGVIKNGSRVQRRLALGARDAITLKDATTKADELRRKLASGIDPVEEAETVEAAKAAKRNARTLRQLFEDRCAKDSSRASVTLVGYADVLNRDVFPELGDKPAADITAEQIAAVLEVAEHRSKWQAHRARSALGSTYRWAIKRRVGGIKQNPVHGLGFTFQGKARDRLATDSELSTIWHATNAQVGMTKPMQLIMKLVILTGQRLSQVVGAQLSELKVLDAANPLWRIPGERMKRKARDQVLPLSVEAAEIFRQAIELGGERVAVTGCVFPADLSRTSKLKPKATRTAHINRESASRAMARLCDNLEIEGLVLHDMRKAVTTYLREVHHTPSDVCDLILHHAPRGVTGSHYDFSILEGPVRLAMQQWSNHVVRIVEHRLDDYQNGL
jgi:integrase